LRMGDVGVAVGVGVSVGVGVAVGVDVSVGVEVTVGVDVSVGVEVIVGVPVGVGVGGDVEKLTTNLGVQEPSLVEKPLKPAPEYSGPRSIKP
jgi:hypothetical protein